jgi:hypothetical protein
MKLWYVYNQAGAHVSSHDTKDQAIAWAKDQQRQWKENGAPRIPVYRVHYNGAVKNEPIEVQP